MKLLYYDLIRGDFQRLLSIQKAMRGIDEIWLDVRSLARIEWKISFAGVCVDCSRYTSILPVVDEISELQTGIVTNSRREIWTEEDWYARFSHIS